MFIWICFDVKVMSKFRMCRYECGTELGDFDEQENKYREVSGTLHTRERCQSLKRQAVTKKEWIPTPERESVLDRYFEDITVERVSSQKDGWKSLDYMPMLWKS
jgi:hypothetical protein